MIVQKPLTDPVTAWRTGVRVAASGFREARVRGCMPMKHVGHTRGRA
jgi:hypothetical protein